MDSEKYDYDVYITRSGYSKKWIGQVRAVSEEEASNIARDRYCTKYDLETHVLIVELPLT